MPETVIDYDILENRVMPLIQEVRAMIALGDGWEPLGAPFLVYREGPAKAHHTVAQAMVKVEPGLAPP